MNQCSKHNGGILKFDGPSCPKCAKLKKNHPTSEALKRARELTSANGGEWYTAFVKYIQYVSDVAERIERASLRYQQTGERSALSEIENEAAALILPRPKPDALVEILGSVTAERLYADLRARGLQITEVPK